MWNLYRGYLHFLLEPEVLLKESLTQLVAENCLLLDVKRSGLQTSLSEGLTHKSERWACFQLA